MTPWEFTEFTPSNMSVLKINLYGLFLKFNKKMFFFHLILMRKTGVYRKYNPFIYFNYVRVLPYNIIYFVIYGG